VDANPIYEACLRTTEKHLSPRGSVKPILSEPASVNWRRVAMGFLMDHPLPTPRQARRPPAVGS
jgi:hypothetical protein